MSLLTELDAIIERGARKASGLHDWSYRDLPAMKPELLDQFVEVVGADNIHWMTRATYSNGLTRGQVLISPEGIRRILEKNRRDSR